MRGRAQTNRGASCIENPFQSDRTVSGDEAGRPSGVSLLLLMVEMLYVAVRANLSGREDRIARSMLSKQFDHLCHIYRRFM